MLPDIHTHRYSPNPYAVYSIRLVSDLPDTPEDYFFPHPVPLFSVGIHPWDFTIKLSTQLSEKEILFLQHPRCVAIGECGLDTIRGNFQEQEVGLHFYFRLAQEQQKPLIIHLVKAWQHWFRLRSEAPADVKCLIHGFKGSPELANRILDSGDWISFGSYWIRQPGLLDLISQLKVPNWLLETDNDPHPEILSNLWGQLNDISDTPKSLESDEKLKTRFKQFLNLGNLDE